MKASLSVSIIHALFLPFRAAKRSVLVDHFETISNYFHQVNQSLEAYVEIFHMISSSEEVIRLAGLQRGRKYYYCLNRVPFYLF